MGALLSRHLRAMEGSRGALPLHRAERLLQFRRFQTRHHQGSQNPGQTAKGPIRRCTGMESQLTALKSFLLQYVIKFAKSVHNTEKFCNFVFGFRFINYKI